MDKTQHTPDDCHPLIEAFERGEVKLESWGRGQYPGKRLKPRQLPGLRSIGYWDAVGPQSWGLPMHRNEGIEICYLLSGETPFSTDQESWVLRPGDITITRPWQRHCLGDPQINACRLFWFILDVECSTENAKWEFPSWVGPDLQTRRELLRILRNNQRCHLHDHSPLMMALIQHACEHLDKESSLVNIRLSDTINRLLFHVAELLSDEDESQASDSQGLSHTVRSFFQSLETNRVAMSEPWTVAKMAHICRVGVTYLTASCHELYNTTPFEQLNRIRLAYASRLLKQQPDQSITEIAFAVGFNSSQYFSTRFKKRYGMSPQAYRLER